MKKLISVLLLATLFLGGFIVGWISSEDFYTERLLMRLEEEF